MANADPDVEQLRGMCRKGQLFEVQEWIKAGRSVTPPRRAKGKTARFSPLRIAIERGFHSLVKVLVEAGAPLVDDSCDALDLAVQMRRPDLVKLILDHGANIQDLCMQTAVGSWAPDVVELCVSHGASLVRDQPIAWGLVNKIRPTLGILKRHVADQPELMRQANTALRHHAGAGSAKWVSLLLWAGADPWERGPEEVRECCEVAAGVEEEEACYHRNAIELAVSRRHLEVLEKTKLIRPPDPKRPESMSLLEDIWFRPDSHVVTLLMEKGHTPRHLADGGNSLIGQLICAIGSHAYDSGERVRVVRMLAAHGAKWLPKDKQEIRYVRQGLLRASSEGVLDFVTAMNEFGAGRWQDIQELLRTPAIIRVMDRRYKRAMGVVEKMREAQQD